MGENRFLIVFAKEPQKGKVKTRLSNGLSPEEIVNLYKAFLKDTVELINKSKTANKIIAYRSDGKPHYLRRIAKGCAFYKQTGNSLGQRIHHAFVFAKSQGSTKTVIIGSDTPDLPSEYIESAFRKLSHHDVVFGPSKDGGYYLVGLKMPVRNIFQSIKWSTSNVLKESLRKAKKANKSVYLLKPWQDVDYCEDLNRLEETLKNKRNIAEHTRKFFYGKHQR